MKTSSELVELSSSTSSSELVSMKTTSACSTSSWIEWIRSKCEVVNTSSPVPPQCRTALRCRWGFPRLHLSCLTSSFLGNLLRNDTFDGKYFLQMVDLYLFFCCLLYFWFIFLMFQSICVLPISLNWPNHRLLWGPKSNTVNVCIITMTSLKWGQ